MAASLTVGSAGSGIYNQIAGSATLKSLNSATPALEIGAAATGSGFVGISGGTFAGGGGGGDPRMFSRIHLPRITGDVRTACDVTVRTLA